MRLTKLLTIAAGASFILAGCASAPQGTVFQQKGGSFKATFSSKTEAAALKVVHQDAEITCKKEKGTERFVVIDQKVEKMTEQAEGAKEGFAAVAGSAVTAVDKYFGSENVRATLIFECGKA